MDKPDHLPDHESGLRRLMSDAGGKPYEAVETLEQAKAHPDGIVVFEGDGGGQIYAVAQVGCVNCSGSALQALLIDIDAHGWNDPTSARISFERGAVGETVSGGMGGGLVAKGIWVHPELESLKAAITEVVIGKRQRLDVA
ncbi:MAG: hypothetical protein HY078_12085 [Elusimicrobia bacterium]|nr:hypothetical protein [Elusimicrobiota bacterium]